MRVLLRPWECCILTLLQQSHKRIRIRIHTGSGRVDPDPDTDRNESTNVPISKLRIETKPKRFDVFQNLKWNVSVYSKNFGTNPKLFDVFQLFFGKSKTLPYNPKKIWKLKKLIAFGPKILKSERKRFGSIMNFVSKTNIFDFFGDVSGKTKAKDLEKRWFDITNQ